MSHPALLWLRRRLWLGGLAGLVVACSPAPAPVSTAKNDPSNPAAAEGVTPTVTSGALPVAPTHDHAHHAATRGADAGAVYVCPMHPEVTSSAPGLCPKCNMKLVPKT